MLEMTSNVICQEKLKGERLRISMYNRKRKHICMHVYGPARMPKKQQKETKSHTFQDNSQKHPVLGPSEVPYSLPSSHAFISQRLGLVGGTKHDHAIQSSPPTVVLSRESTAQLTPPVPLRL